MKQTRNMKAVEKAYRADYLTGKCTLTEFAQRYKVNPATVNRWANKYGWPMKQAKIRHNNLPTVVPLPKYDEPTVEVIRETFRISVKNAYNIAKWMAVQIERRDKDAYTAKTIETYMRSNAILIQTAAINSEVLCRLEDHDESDRESVAIEYEVITRGAVTASDEDDD